NGELSPASPLQGGFDGLDIGAPEAGLIVTPARAEAPGVDQCARGGIVGAAAGLGDVEGISKHFEKSLRQYLPATGRRPVETAEIGIRQPMAHLRNYGVELSLNLLLPAACGLFVRRMGGRDIDQSHRPCSAHGFAAAVENSAACGRNLGRSCLGNENTA